MKNKPIKRHKGLQPLSREHHHTLLLCWKIRTGFAKGISTERMKKYADWFFDNHIQPHFKDEEAFIFPTLGPDHELIKKAIAEHRRLSRLFQEREEIARSLSLIEEELESHIRFEERVLFGEIQKVASEGQLEAISQLHTETEFIDNTRDEFWK